MDNLYLGIEIGGTKLQLVLGDGAANIVQRRRLTVLPEEGGAGIRRQIQTALPDLMRTSSPRAIGVGFGGPVDWKTGRICCSHQIPGWSEFEFGDWLRELTGLPVRVDNDANTAALGEATRGAGVGLNPVFYVTLGSGVGGGLVVAGHIYHGAKPGESEIGHLHLDREGTIVEARCSGWAVDQRIRQLKTTQPSSLLARLAGKVIGGEARHPVPACQQGDAAALKILSEVAADLAFALSHVTQLFHPEIIVLGGGLALAGEPLRAAVDLALRGYVMQAFVPGPALALALLGEDAVPVGALKLAMESAA